VHLRIAESTRVHRAVALVVTLALVPTLATAQDAGKKGGGGAKADAKSDTKSGSKDGRGGAGGRTASVILSATDVYKVTRGSI
jgi:hypothetical protein